MEERERGDTETGSKLLIDDEGLTPISLRVNVCPVYVRCGDGDLCQEKIVKSHKIDIISRWVIYVQCE